MPIEDDKIIKEILTIAKTIAVVGASNKPLRDSLRIVQYLKREQYCVFPVNPMYAEIDGEKCYPNLSSIEKPIDIVDVFRNPDAVDEIVVEAIAVKAKTIWLQSAEVRGGSGSPSSLDSFLEPPALSRQHGPLLTVRHTRRYAPLASPGDQSVSSNFRTCCRL